VDLNVLRPAAWHARSRSLQRSTTRLKPRDRQVRVTPPIQLPHRQRNCERAAGALVSNGYSLRPWNRPLGGWPDRPPGSGR